MVWLRTPGSLASRETLCQCVLGFSMPFPFSCKPTHALLPLGKGTGLIQAGGWLYYLLQDDADLYSGRAIKPWLWLMAVHSWRKPLKPQVSWESGLLFVAFWACLQIICMYWLHESVYVFFPRFPCTQTLIKLARHYKRLLCGQLWKDHSSACQRGQRPFDLGSLLYMCVRLCVSSRAKWVLSSCHWWVCALKARPDPFKVKPVSCIVRKIWQRCTMATPRLNSHIPSFSLLA